MTPKNDIMAGQEAHIKIRLPLPLDITATISNLLSRAYPNTVIEPNDFDLVLRVTAEDRMSPVLMSDEQVAEEILPTSNPDEEGEFLAWGADSIKIGTPESVAFPMAHILRTFFKEHPEAKNYMEMFVHDRDDASKTYVVTACRSKGQTPHALRVVEREKLDEIAALCGNRNSEIVRQIREVLDR